MNFAPAPSEQVPDRFLSLRWWIVALLFCATVLNYIDRQSLSILASTIQHAFRIDDVGYGHVVTAFLVAYSLAYAVTGRVSDKLGARWSMALFIVWWSLAELMPPLVHGANGLVASRFLLGLGEAGIWVVAPKVIGELFTPESRALAIGVYTAGGTLGAALAPPAVSAISQGFGWPMVFFASGVLGLLWLAPWLAFTAHLPNDSRPRVWSREGGWLGLLRVRNLWLLLLARFLTDPVWYFYLFWFPKYLEDVRHEQFARVGHSIWLVYLAADVATVTGGALAWWLIRRGREPLRVRKLLMGGAACVFPLSFLAPLLPSLSGIVAAGSLLAFAHMVWLVTLTAAVVDLFPPESVGSAAGWIAAGSGLGGIVFTEVIGHCVSGFGYLPLFCVMGVLHPLAFLSISRLRAPEAPATAALKKGNI